MVFLPFSADIRLIRNSSFKVGMIVLVACCTSFGALLVSNFDGHCSRLLERVLAPAVGANPHAEISFSNSQGVGLICPSSLLI